MFTEPRTDEELVESVRARTFFSVSTFVCTPSALSQGADDALGAQAGEAELRRVVEAGRLHTLPPGRRDPAFMVIEARPSTITTSMGEVDFPISCSQQAQEEFEVGLAQLHHMMYEQAREHFEAAAEADAQCAMAHWGIAMTSFQPLWHPTSEEDLERGRAAVEAARQIGAPTERERAHIAAVEAFFTDPVPAAPSRSGRSRSTGDRLEGGAARLHEAHRRTWTPPPSMPWRRSPMPGAVLARGGARLHPAAGGGRAPAGLSRASPRASGAAPLPPARLRQRGAGAGCGGGRGGVRRPGPGDGACPPHAEPHLRAPRAVGGDGRVQRALRPGGAAPRREGSGRAATRRCTTPTPWTT
jgi:hypothetical protein